MRILPIITAIAVSFLSVACSTPAPPPGVTVVSPFDVQRYLGTWYEIARFDHPRWSAAPIATISGCWPGRRPSPRRSGSRCWTLPPDRALMSANWSGSISAMISAR